MTVDQIEKLILSVLASPKVFESLLPYLDKPEWKDDQVVYKAITTCLVRFYAQFQRKPNAVELASFIDEQQDLTRLFLADYENEESLAELLNFSRDLEADDLFDVDVARSLWTRLCQDLLTAKMSAALMQGQPTDLIGFTTAYAQTATELHELSDASGIVDAFAPGWEKDIESLKPRPFGVGFMDKLLQGGGVSGHAYLLLGPTGSCKTTLMTMMATSQAIEEQKRWYARGRTSSLGLVYYFTWEENLIKLLCRAIAQCAMIPYEKLRRKEPLSLPGQISEEDAINFAPMIQEGIRIPCEAVRKKRVEDTLRRNMRYVDYSVIHDQSNAMKGTSAHLGLASEIRKDLRKVSKERGIPCHCAGVYIDYLGLMMDRYSSSQSLDKDEARLALASSVMAIRSGISGQFGCTTWILHQLNGSANEYASGKVASASQGKDCKTLAVNAEVAMVLSKPDENGIIRLFVDKMREGKGQVSTILQLMGAYSKVVSVDDYYAFDPRFNRIRKRSDAPPTVALTHDLKY